VDDVVNFKRVVRATVLSAQRTIGSRRTFRHMASAAYWRKDGGRAEMARHLALLLHRRRRDGAATGKIELERGAAVK